jgi:hypothetical protein
MGRLDEAGAQQDLEQFLESRDTATGTRADDPVAP